MRRVELQKNIAVAVLSVFMMIISIFLVFSIRTSRGSEKTAAWISDPYGMVYITRNSVVFPVDHDTPLRDGDLITTMEGAGAILVMDEPEALNISEQTQVLVTNADRKQFLMEVSSGRVYLGDSNNRAVDQSKLTMHPSLSELNLEFECTLTIRCDTILEHWDALKPAKSEFVPTDGMILQKVRVPFSQGETAFDITKRACEAYYLPLEYSYTPLNKSYYVEGINNIYEFDCGPESGWMFRVNGWFPNHGASSFKVSNGDDIVWEYTSVGLGADLKEAGYE